MYLVHRPARVFFSKARRSERARSQLGASKLLMNSNLNHQEHVRLAGLQRLVYFCNPVVIPWQTLSVSQDSLVNDEFLLGKHSNDTQIKIRKQVQTRV